MPSKGKSKTTKKRTCWIFTKNRSHGKKELNRYWTRETFSLRVRGIEESDSSSSSPTESPPRRRWSVSFLEEHLQNPLTQSIHWSDDRWKACLAAGGGAKRRFQYCTDSSGTIVYFQALQGHSGRNLIDPSLQDNVVIQSGFFQHIYHKGCAFNLHSIINSGLIPGGQNLNKRQKVWSVTVDPMDKSRKDPDEIDLNVPRLARYLQNAWKKHHNTVYWVDINLAVEKGLKFCQTRSNAIILQEALSAYCIPKVVRLQTGEIFYEKVYISPRLPPKISLRHEWTRELGSGHAQRPEVGQLSRISNSNQPIPNPSRERTVRPVVKDDTKIVQDGRNTSRSQEINVNSFHEETVSTERTGRPVVETSVIQTCSSEDSKDPNVETTHEKTRPVVETNTENVPDGCETRSCDLITCKIKEKRPVLKRSIFFFAKNSVLQFRTGRLFETDVIQTRSS